MSRGAISRRDLFGMGVGAVATAALAPLVLTQQAYASGAGGGSPIQGADNYLGSINRGFAFQEMMMDAYATGDTVRLTQSYSDGGLESTSFTYDNAVSIHAYLLRGNADGLKRAEVLGNGLIYAQANNFPINDGRFGQAYFVNVPTSDGAYITPAAFPFYFYTSAGWDGAGTALSTDRTEQVSYGGSQGGELDRDEYLQRAGSGRIFVRNERQPVQPVGAVHQWQIDRAQYRHLCVLHNGGGADSERQRRQWRVVVESGAACVDVCDRDVQPGGRILLHRYAGRPDHD